MIMTVIEGYIRLGLTIMLAIIILWILFRFRASKHPHKSSLDILKERVEQGEITKEEYEAARKRQKR